MQGFSVRQACDTSPTPHIPPVFRNRSINKCQDGDIEWHGWFGEDFSTSTLSLKNSRRPFTVPSASHCDFSINLGITT